MNRSLLLTASLLGALSVVLGAFAAHSLKEIFPPESLAIFETGVRYQFYHVFAIFLAAILGGQLRESRLFLRAGYCFIAGIILFSGSLYALATLKANGMAGLGAIGILTPLGGLSFIAGWILICAGVYRDKKNL
ncbi:MAG TPA: DUF423 domain-containing protein [Puia sp.]|nr:DUF423 domain-containing protein [Puia sp.]